MATVKDSIIFWNCGGGIKSKIDFIRNFIHSHKPSLFFVSESEISQHDLGIVQIQGYDLLTANTLNSNSKARLACYIKSEVRYKLLIIDDKLDILGLDIGGLRVIGVYKPFKLPEHSNRISFFDSIIRTLQKLCQTDKQLLVGGDFNVDLLKKSSNLNDLQNWAINNGLTQLVKSHLEETSIKSSPNISH